MKEGTCINKRLRLYFPHSFRKKIMKKEQRLVEKWSMRFKLVKKRSRGINTLIIKLWRDQSAL